MRALVIPILLWIAVLPVIASGIEVSGDVWGVWSPVNNPYEVVGELRVPPESTLVIEPGVFVNFQGHYKFIVDTLAMLQAIGTETDSIYFTTDDTATGWHGIRFLYADDNSQITYTCLEYGKATGDGHDRNGGAIYCYYSGAAVRNNTISHNHAFSYGAGVYCSYSSISIDNNVITDNRAYSHGGGVHADNSTVTISSNVISGNVGRCGGGVYCSGSNARISNNTISANTATSLWGGDGGGMSCWSCDLTVTNNTIIENRAEDGSGGIECLYTDGTISGNTIADNRAASIGGIGCYQCNLTISSNTIRGNQATGSPYFGEGNAGGIACCSASLVITDNTVNENWAGWCGGGIYCDYSDLEIDNNTVVGNCALYYGGGIDCYMSDPTISNSTIKSNYAGLYGGGISCYGSDPIMTGNTIDDNFSETGGGGIFCEFSHPIVKYNILSNNSTWGSGGGVLCVRYSDPSLVNNTITANSAFYGGGFACRRYSNPTIINTILLADTAISGPEIHMSVSHGGPCTLFVSYSDVDGGEGNVYVEPGCYLSWGEGNIDADPIFAGPYNKDFYLRWHSPCIDAGDPDPQYNDPDGTRNDIGARYFNQDVAGIVELYPPDTLIVIPPEGGDIIYDGWVFNFLGRPGSADIWTYAFAPEMGQYGPLSLYENVRIPADSLGKNQITQHVPGVAPEGDYVFVVYVGNYPSTIIDSSCFYFTKTGSVAGGIAAWQSLKAWFDGGLASKESGLPTHYALSQNYPNPFNTTTIINYQLPVDAYVKLEICNLFGQKLATLVDFRQQGGNRSVIWDASKFSSGIYFYRLTAGDYTFTRKMVLSK